MIQFPRYKITEISVIARKRRTDADADPGGSKTDGSG
jgi:hypothetical protein